MVTIAEVVAEFVHKEPFVEEALQKGIINLSSLARFLSPEIEKKLHKSVKTGAVVMALRRYRAPVQTRNVNRIFDGVPEMILRSGLVEITYENSEGLIEKAGKLFHPGAQTKNLFCTITQGVFETAVITNMFFLKRLETVFKNEKVIALLSNLTAITIRLPQENVEMPGVYYRILKTLAWNNINIIDIVSTNTEFTILLKDSEVELGFSALKKLFRGNTT